MADLDIKAVISRIRQLRHNHSGPRGKKNFAEKLGISSSTYNYYENDRLPPANILLKICNITNTDINWLLKGRSESDTPENQHDPLLNQVKSLLQDPENRAPISAFVDLISKKASSGLQQNLAVNKNNQTRQGWVPILGRTAAGVAAYWSQADISNPDSARVDLETLISRHSNSQMLNCHPAEINSTANLTQITQNLNTTTVSIIQLPELEADGICEFVDFGQLKRILPDCFALRIDGESMSPRIDDNDIVLLSPSVAAIEAQPAVVRLRDQIGVTCKIFRTTDQKVHLIPINEKYAPLAIDSSEVVWALAVLCSIKTRQRFKQ